MIEANASNDGLRLIYKQNPPSISDAKIFYDNNINQPIQATKSVEELLLWQPFKDLAYSIENDSLTSTAVNERKKSEEENIALTNKNNAASAVFGSTNANRAQNSVYRD